MPAPAKKASTLPQSPLALYRALSPLLRPLSLPYAALMRRRRARYARPGNAHVAPCPVVSVGNIAWGGTGKTPVVSWLLEHSRKAGLSAAVLTRGYGGTPGEAPLIVAAETPPEQSGDEALMLAAAHPEARVIVFPKRAESARLAEERFSPELMILDDGMQHLAVARDIDLVLLRPEDLREDWGKVIPSGPWREGEEALLAASAFLVKTAEAQSLHAARFEEDLHRRLAGFGKPVFTFSLCPIGLRPLFPKEGATAGYLAPESYANTAYVLLSGVGNPEGVEESACRFMGRAPVRHFDFADHHAYTASDIQAVTKLSPAPLPVVCTAKDAVKLKGVANGLNTAPIWVLDTAATFGPAYFTDNTFPEWWDHTFAEAQHKKGLPS